jgi:hypothetical protein
LKEFDAFAQNLKSSIGDILGTASAAASFGGGVHTDGGMEHGSASVDFPLFGDLDSKSFWAAFVNSLLMIIGMSNDRMDRSRSMDNSLCCIRKIK